MVWNGDVKRTLDELYVGAGLSQLFKSKAFQRFDYVMARGIARKLHKSARTGSATKWKRTFLGTSDGSKWHRTASPT